MAKKRKKPRRDASARPAASEASRAAAAPGSAASRQLPKAFDALDVRWVIVVFLVALAAYLLVFFSAPQPTLTTAGEPRELTRLDLAMWLWMIRLPELLSAWTGGSWANVGLFGRLAVGGAAAVQLFVAALLGRLLLHALGVVGNSRRLLTRLEANVFSVAAGLSAMSLFTLLVGLAGGLQSPWPFVALAVAVLGITAYRNLEKRERKAAGGEHAPPPPATRFDWLPAAALWLLVPFVVVILLAGLCPPREFDVREYHLNAPKEWYLAGRITFEHHNIYANMPLAAELLSLPVMAVWPSEQSWWWGALVGKTLIAAFAPLTALALFTAGRRFFSTTAGVIAALVYISIPWIAHVSMEGLIDGVLAFYVFIAFYATLIALQVSREPSSTDSPASESRRAFLLAGFLAGSAAACKYPGLLYAVIPLAILILCYRRTPRRNLPALVLFVLAALAVSGPWYAKNWGLAGNPFYPLAYNWFDGQSRTPEKDLQWRTAHAVPQDEYGASYTPRQFIDSAAHVGWESEWLSPLVWPLALLAPLALVALRQFEPAASANSLGASRQVIFLSAGLAMWILLVWWFFTHRIDRFWLPALPALALLAGVGATWSANRWWRQLVLALLFWGLAWNLLVIAGALAPDKLLVALDRQRSDPARVHRAHLYLNEHTRLGKKVLLVGDAQPFDLDVPALWSTCFDTAVIEELLKDKSPQEQWKTLHNHDIAYVFVRWSEIDRYRLPGNYGFTDYVTEPLMRELVRRGVLKKPWGIRDPQSGEINRFVGQIYPVAETSPTAPSPQSEPEAARRD